MLGKPWLMVAERGSVLAEDWLEELEVEVLVVTEELELALEEVVIFPFLCFVRGVVSPSGLRLQLHPIDTCNR